MLADYQGAHTTTQKTENKGYKTQLPPQLLALRATVLYAHVPMLGSPSSLRAAHAADLHKHLQRLRGSALLVLLDIELYREPLPSYKVCAGAESTAFKQIFK